jgi:YYY domain-containing protein
MSGFSGVGLLPSGIRTSLAGFMELCALFLFVLITFLLVMWKREFFAGKRAIVVAVAFLIPIILLAVFLHFQILVVVVPIGLLCLYFLYKSKTKSEREFVLLLIIMGVALAFFCDFVYIKDALSGQWVRFNTVMKIYHQLWIFLGISAACGVYYVLSHFTGKRWFIRIGKAVWIGIVALLIVAALVHPIATTVSMTSGRNSFWGVSRGTLDGMAYIEKVNKGDYEAIQWINKNINGSPVILEMPGDTGSYSSRVSAFTGLPTVIGWRGWEVVWRIGGNNLGERSDDVDLAYNTSDNAKALELLRKYNVEYIYIGTLEQNKYTAEGLQKFDTFKDDYQLIYQNEGVTIYQLKGY